MVNILSYPKSNDPDESNPDQTAVFRGSGRHALSANDHFGALAKIGVRELLGQVGIGDGLKRQRFGPERQSQTRARYPGNNSEN